MPFGLDWPTDWSVKPERGPALAGLESGWPALRSATWRRRLPITIPLPRAHQARAYRALHPIRYTELHACATWKLQPAVHAQLVLRCYIHTHVHTTQRHDEPNDIYSTARPPRLGLSLLTTLARNTSIRKLELMISPAETTRPTRAPQGASACIASMPQPRFAACVCLHRRHVTVRKPGQGARVRSDTFDPEYERQDGIDCLRCSACNLSAQAFI